MSHLYFNRYLAGVAVAVLMAVSMWTQPVWARSPAPVVDASSSGTSAGVRQNQSNNPALLELLDRMDKLELEVQRLLGAQEEQNHKLEGLNKRQRDLYLDIDQRLRKLEQAKTSAPAAMGAFVPAPAPAGTSITTPPGNTAAGTGAPVVSGNTDTPPPPVDESHKERAAYENAFNVLKDGRYEQAIVAFKAFVKDYPKGRYASNAQYWLGEANYVQRNFKTALSEFGKVVENFPNSPKRADAMLKMGYTYQELGQIDEARLSLSNVSKFYPNTTAANLAQKRLKALK